MAVSADFSEVERLAADLGRASRSVVDEARKVVFKGAMNIKGAARDNVSTHPSWKRLASTINFDIFGLTADIGYDDRGQGNLAGIAEFGSARHAPHPALMPAARDEAPRFEKAILDVAAKALKDLL